MLQRISAGPTRFLALAVLAVTIAACSSPAGSSPTAAAPATSAPAAGLQVTVATDTKLGMFLAGEGGKTLYIFRRDTANASNCAGDCATTWPPLTVDAGEQVNGAAGITGTFSTFARADGKTQVAYNTAPLYYYAPDTAAGDVKGEGVGGVWFVAKP
jgi:predicted lipoprotein with Yx(FWY)xxD motif